MKSVRIIVDKLGIKVPQTEKNLKIEWTRGVSDQAVLRESELQWSGQPLGAAVSQR